MPANDQRAPDPAPGEDERVAALHAVLRGNGVGGAAPFTIEGEIQGFGNVANGVRRSGWRRFAAYAIAALILGAIALGTLVTVQSIVSSTT